jgi:hypothetical protein
LRVANLLEEITEDGRVARLVAFEALDAFADGARVAQSRTTAQGEEDLCFVGEVGVEGSSAATCLGSDIFNSRGLKAVARKDFLGSAEEVHTGSFRP